MKALIVDGVSKYFRTRGKLIEAVKKVSFEIEKGEIFGLLGPNGSGKSTIVRMISTLLIPDEGKIEVFGYDVVRYPKKVQSMINRVSVEASFFKKLSAMENLLFTAGIYGIPLNAAREKIKMISRKIGLSESRLNDPLEEFSRGMQQKVAIARAFLTSPILLLLDEPTTGLDPRAKREVQDLILQVIKEHDATVLLTTHDMTEAETLCDRIGILHRGKLVAIGSPKELKEKANAYTMEEVFMFFTGEMFEDLEVVE